MKKLLLFALFALLVPASAWAQSVGVGVGNPGMMGAGRYRLNPYGPYANPYGNNYGYGYGTPVPPVNDPNTATVGRPYYYGYPAPGYDPNYGGGVQSDGDSVWVPGN
jgi:hypothetical protein